MIERRPITDREQWLQWRRQDITASRVGALFGVHPYETALRLYAEKRGVEFPDADNKTMRRGRWMEPAVAKAVEELRPDWKLEQPKLYLRDPDIRLGCTPDFFIHDPVRGLGVLQCKTVAPSVYIRDWFGGLEIPFWVVLQNLSETMLTGAEFGVVAALLIDPHSMECAILDVPRHPGGEEKIRTAVKNFWLAVENGIEPDPDFARDSEIVKLLNPRETPGKSIDLAGNNELPAMLDERAALINAIKMADERKTEIESKIRYLMADAETATGLPDWRISLRTTDFKGYEVKPRSQRVLRIKHLQENPT